MRIALLLGSLATGGAERQFALLASALATRGHAVRLITMETGHDDPAYVALLEGVERRVLYEAKWPGPLRLAQLLAAWRPLRDELRAFNAEVIYAALEWPDWLATRAAAALTPRPAVSVGFRNSAEAMSWKRRLPLILLARCGRADVVIANSRAGLDEARRQGVVARREVVIPNGIDTETFAPDPDGGQQLRARLRVGADTPLLGHVGRLSPMKDHETLLRAFAAIRRARPECQLLCVGRGPAALGDRLRSLVAALGVADAVRWQERADAMPALYSALDLLILSSRDGEGFPNTVAEAMACGTACAVTDVGEAASIVGDTGRVAPRRDPDALAQAALALLDRPDSGAGTRARIVAEFSVARLAEATERALAEAVEAARCRSGDAPDSGYAAPP